MLDVEALDLCFARECDGVQSDKHPSGLPVEEFADQEEGPEWRLGSCGMQFLGSAAQWRVSAHVPCTHVSVLVARSEYVGAEVSDLPIGSHGELEDLLAQFRWEVHDAGGHFGLDIFCDDSIEGSAKVDAVSIFELRRVVRIL